MSPPGSLSSAVLRLAGLVALGCSDTSLSVVQDALPEREPSRIVEVNPPSVQVLDLGPDESWSDIVVLTSVGEGAVTVGRVGAVGTGWSLEAASVPVELSPGSSLVVALNFAGAPPGNWPGEVEFAVETDAGSVVTVPLEARVEAAEPDSGSVPQVDTGDGGEGDTGLQRDTGMQVPGGCGAISPFTLSVVGRLDVPGTAQIGLDTARRRLIVPYEYGGQAVGVYDLDDFTLLDTLPAGSAPNPSLVDDLGGHLLVGNKLSATVSVYDAETLASTETLDIVDPQHFVADPDRGLVYVASMSEGEVLALDAVSLAEVGRVSLDPWLRQGAYGDGRAIFPSTSGRLHVFDTSTLAASGSVSLGEQLFGSAFLPDLDRIYASGWDTGTIYVLQASTLAVVSTLAAGAPYQMTTDPDRCLVAVAGYGDDHLRIIDATTDRVVADDEVCPAPMDVAFDAPTGRWLVACYGSDEIVALEER